MALAYINFEVVRHQITMMSKWETLCLGASLTRPFPTLPRQAFEASITVIYEPFHSFPIDGCLLSLLLFVFPSPSYTLGKFHSSISKLSITGVLEGEFPAGTFILSSASYLPFSETK